MLVLLSVLLAASPIELPVPFVHQKPDFCGEAAAEMALRSMGQPVTQDDVFEASGVDPLLGRGALTNELARALRHFGVDPGPTWYRVDPAKAATQLDQQWRALRDDLRAGQPSIVCMHYDATPKTTEHFRLVTGFDESTDELIYQEPAEPDGANRRMKRADFLALWTFKPAKDRWTLIRLRLPKPSRPSAVTLPASPRPAEVSQHVQTLKQTLPKNFTIVWEAPFLVIGDESPERVRSRAKDVVRWCRDLLLKDFFTEAPQSLHEVWVLKDAASYEHASKTLFQTTPTTPYGYYLSSRRALVMNIKPGYGTLTHELVHPFMHQAWPETPAWINEGVASLFEFPYEDGGHLKGRVNWRLPGLQRALPTGSVPTFFELTHMSDDVFYEDEAGVNYAAARYLCFWLQEHGLLTRFMKRALELKATDPTGHQALSEVLGGDPERRRAEWERFVLALRKR
jgi:hypothetical protein